MSDKWRVASFRVPDDMDDWIDSLVRARPDLFPTRSSVVRASLVVFRRELDDRIARGGMI